MTPITKPATMPAAICTQPVKAGDRGRVVRQQQHARDDDQQHGNDAIERLGLEASCPFCAGVCAEQASSEQIHDDRPVAPDFGKRHGCRSEREGGGNHDQAGCLVQDNGFEAAESKQTYQQRQPEFGTSEADQSAERSDNRTTPERSNRVAARAPGVRHLICLT
jgi:hypothetical protein